MWGRHFCLPLGLGFWIGRVVEGAIVADRGSRMVLGKGIGGRFRSRDVAVPIPPFSS